MKKRLLCWLLTLSLMLSLAPGMTITASAWGKTPYDTLIKGISNQTLLDNCIFGTMEEGNDDHGYFAIDGNKITNSDSRNAQLSTSGHSTKAFTFNNPPQSDCSCATFIRIVLKPSEASRMLTFKVNLPDKGTYSYDGVFRLFVFNSAVPYVDNSPAHSYDPQLSRDEYAVGGSKQPEIVGDSKLLPNNATYVQEKVGGGEATFGAVIKPSPEKNVYVYLVYDPARNNWGGGDDSAATRFELNDYNANFSISDLNLYDEVPDTLKVAASNDYIMRETINGTSSIHTESYDKKIYYHDEKRPTLELLTLAGKSPYLFSGSSNIYTAAKTTLNFNGSGTNLKTVSQSGSASGISSALAGLASQGLYLGNAANGGTWNSSASTLTVNGQLSVPLYSATKDTFLTISGDNISSVTFNDSISTKKDNFYTLRIPKETYGEMHINTSASSPLKFNTDTTEKHPVSITFNDGSNTLGNSQELTYGNNLCELLKVTYDGQPVNEQGAFSWSLSEGTTTHIDTSGMADAAGTRITEGYKVTFNSSSYYGEAELSLNKCAIDKRALTMTLGGELVKQYDGTNDLVIYDRLNVTCAFDGYLSKDADIFKNIKTLEDVRLPNDSMLGTFSSPDAGTGINVVINNYGFYRLERDVYPVLKNYYIKEGSSGNIGTIRPKKLTQVNGFSILPRAYEAGNTKVQLIAENLTLSESEILERDKGKVGVALKSSINPKEFERGEDNVGTASVPIYFQANLELTGENSKNYIFTEKFNYALVKSLVYTETYSPKLLFYLPDDSSSQFENYTATYTGEAIKPYIMTADKRYYMYALKGYCDIEYSNNIEPGTATVTIRNKDQRYPTSDGKLIFFTTTSANFTIQQLETTEAASLADTNKGSNNWYIGDVTVNAPNGFQISKEIGQNANWQNFLVVTEDMNDNFTYYLKKTADGSVTASKAIEIKRDSTEPTISTINNSNITDHDAIVTINASDNGSGIVSYELSKTSGGTSEPTINSDGNGVFNISGLLTDTQYDFTATVKDNAGNMTTQDLSFTTEKTLPNTDEPSFNSAVYGTPLSKLTINPGTSDVAGSWVLDDKINNADSIYPTVNDTTEYTVVFIPSENPSNYGKLTRKLKPIITPKELTLSDATALDKKYDGKNTVDIKNVILNGIINSDDVYVDTNGLTGTLNGTDVGTYNAVKIGNMTLAGAMAGNYTLNQPSEAMTTTVEISRADAFSLNSPAIMAKNQDNYTLRLDLTQISGYPLTPDCTPVFTVSSNNYNSLSSATMDGNTLVLVTNKMQNYTSDTVTIDVTDMDNYEDSTITVNVDYTDKVPVNISGVTVSDKSYDGSEISYSGAPVSTSSVDNSEITPTGYNYTWQTASGQTLSDPPKNAGDYKLIISVEDNDPDYIGSEVLNFTISKATITITADNKTAYINDKKPTLTYTVSGLAPNEELKKAPNLSCNSSMGKINTYAIAANGALVPEGGNYNKKIRYINGVLTVSDRPSSGNSGSNGSSNNTSSVGKNSVNVINTKNGTIKASPDHAEEGHTVSINITPNKGYKLSTLSVTDKKGKSLKLNKKSDILYTFEMPDSVVNITPEFVKISKPEQIKLPFVDVTEGAWYQPSVKYVYEKGLMTGSSDTNFMPNKTTSRSMIVTMLYRLEKSPQVSGNHFKDIANGLYYTDAVTWASEHNIVSGYGNNMFGPNDTLTREQLVVILYRYAQYKGYNVTAKADLSAYKDSAQVGSYASEAMQWANVAGIVNGTNAATLSPRGTATRAQVATILMRFVENTAI